MLQSLFPKYKYSILSFIQLDFDREHIVPKKGFARSSIFEAMNERGLE